MATNTIPGVSPASILAAALTTGTGPSTQAVFSADGPAFLPSMMQEVVWLPQTAVFQCNFQILGSLISLGWATGNVTAVTSNYTALSTDAVILASAASGAITITLPDATQQGFFGGQRYTVVKIDATVNAVTVTGTNGQLINGASTVTLGTQYATTGVVFDTTSSLAPDWIVWNGIAALTSTLFTPTNAKTSNYDANPADYVVCNVSGGSFTVTLPDAPANGTVVGAELAAGAGTNTVTVATQGSDVFDSVGGATSRTLKLLDQAVLWQYASGPKIWYGFANNLPLSDLDLRYVQSAVPVGISGATAGPVLEVANTTGSPSSPALTVTSADAGYPAFGAEVSGDGDYRFTADSRGKLQWGSGAAAADTDLYRASAGTLQTDGGLTVAGQLLANNFPVTPPVPPSAATAETFPRIIANGTTSTLQTQTLYVAAIQLPEGLKVNGCAVCVKGTSTGGATITHAWYVLMDTGPVVRAVTADQNGSTSFMASTNVLYPLSFASSYTIPSAGVYYIGVMVECGTMPDLASNGAVSNGLASASPVLCGTSSTGQTTPPSTGTTMTALSGAGGFAFYAYTD